MLSTATQKLSKKTAKFARLLVNEYKDVEIISMSGGFSIVLKGLNIRIQRIEAIKAIDYEEIGELMNMTKIESEIEIMGKLDHKNVVKVYNTLRKTTEEDDYLFIIMEYCETSLAAKIKDSMYNLPNSLVNTYIREIVDGVEYLHEHRIIHRDLKPDNIFIKEGQLKIGDFNISKMEGTHRHTMSASEIFLTLKYSPPERIANLIGDERIDSWSIGCIIYELFEGQSPFDSASEVQIMNNINAIKYPPPINSDYIYNVIYSLTLTPEEKRIRVTVLSELLKQMDKPQGDQHTRKALPDSGITNEASQKEIIEVKYIYVYIYIYILLYI